MRACSRILMRLEMNGAGKSHAWMILMGFCHGNVWLHGPFQCAGRRMAPRRNLGHRLGGCSGVKEETQERELWAFMLVFSSGNAKNCRPSIRSSAYGGGMRGDLALIISVTGSLGLQVSLAQPRHTHPKIDINTMSCVSQPSSRVASPLLPSFPLSLSIHRPYWWAFLTGAGAGSPIDLNHWKGLISLPSLDGM